MSCSSCWWKLCVNNWQSTTHEKGRYAPRVLDLTSRVSVHLNSCPLLMCESHDSCKKQQPCQKDMASNTRSGTRSTLERHPLLKSERNFLSHQVRRMIYAPSRTCVELVQKVKPKCVSSKRNAEKRFLRDVGFVRCKALSNLCCFFFYDDMVKAAREQSCTWWAPSAAQDKKARSTAGASSAGRRVRPREPSRWSRRRSAQPGIVHVHPCCSLQPERLSPDPPTQGRTMCSAGRRICCRWPVR